MSLSFNAYQQTAKETDQRKPEDSDGLTVALLGLVGEAGSLLTEYKKKLRDGAAHRGFNAQVEEELGDLLWYLAAIATRCGLQLEEVAKKNLEKTRARWLMPAERAPLFDEDRPPREQLPREFEFEYEFPVIKGVRRAVLRDRASGKLVGDPLTDNAYEEDGYRFHDILHIAHMAVLGWSPVMRKLLTCKRTSNDAVDHVDEVEDGARAAIADELAAAAAYEYAVRHNDLDVAHVDWDLLRLLKRVTSRLEVKVRTEAEWEDAILQAFRVWRSVRKHNGGRIRGNLLTSTLEFVPPSSIL